MEQNTCDLLTIRKKSISHGSLVFFFFFVNMFKMPFSTIKIMYVDRLD